VITRYFTDCGWFAITNKISYWLRMICDHKQDILLTADDRRSRTSFFLLTVDDLRSQTRYFTDCGWFAITNKIFYWLRMIGDHKQDILLTADMWSEDTLLTEDDRRSQTRYFTDCGWFAITNKIFYWLWIIFDHKQDILLTAYDRRSETRYFTDCGWHVITRYFTDCGW